MKHVWDKENNIYGCKGNAVWNDMAEGSNLEITVD
jgi:hypothetical protein